MLLLPRRDDGQYFSHYLRVLLVEMLLDCFVPSQSLTAEYAAFHECGMKLRTSSCRRGIMKNLLLKVVMLFSVVRRGSLPVRSLPREQMNFRAGVVFNVLPKLEARPNSTSTGQTFGRASARELNLVKFRALAQGTAVGMLSL